MKNILLGIVFITILCALGAAAIGVFPGKIPSFGKNAPLRTETPLGRYTKFYQRHVFPFTHSDGQPDSLTYFFYPPEPPYPENLRFPLVLVMHGSPGNAYAGEHLIRHPARIDYPAFIVAPVLTMNKRWTAWSGTPIAYEEERAAQEKYGVYAAVELVKALAQSYPVDTSRIYVIGCSEGGFGAFAAALFYPDIFAAAMPISGGWPVRGASHLGKVPVWAIHSAQDSVIPAKLTRDITSAAKKLGAKNVFYTEIPDMDHNCPSERLYTQATWKWLFSQKKAR